MRPPLSPTERMSPVESKLIADSKSCLPIAEALGSPKLLRNCKLRGSMFSSEPILFCLARFGDPTGEVNPFDMIISENSVALLENPNLVGDIGGEGLLQDAVDISN